MGGPNAREMPDLAVSPVIGVMLMLAITIVVAATLSAFIGGASTGYEKTPQLSLDVVCDGSGDDFNLVFEHRSGDYLKTEDLKIVSWVKNADGKMVKHEQTKDSYLTDVDGTGLRLPYIYDSQDGTDSSLEFGDAVWKAGMSAGTGDLKATADFLGLADGSELEDLIDSGESVEIDIVYLPSGNTIFKKEFILV
ncbi:FlaG/FlaF family flagellin (archaellin) [Methanomicrobium sp. W14]|nr:FlaG/FlaF family flagellin (archaellin) [Methanomicrobium sp. W14]